MKDDYEIFLLEIRQGVKESEERLKHLACIDISAFRGVRAAKIAIQQELVNYRFGPKDKNKQLTELMGG